MQRKIWKVRPEIRTRTLGVAVLFTFVVIVTSCNRSDRGTASSSERPTLKLRDLTTSSSPAVSRLAPQARIASAGPDYQLSRVFDAVALPSGELVVLQARGEQLLVFDSIGQYARGIGRRGAGPGEFDVPTKIGRRGDSLWIFDRALSRITVFRPSGTLVRTIALPANGVGVLHEDGRVTIHSDRALGSSAAGQDSLSLQELRAGGRLSPIRHPAANVHHSLSYSVGGRSAVGLQPFDDGPLIAELAGESGFWFVRQAADDGGAQLRIERVDPSWRTMVDQPYPFDPVRMSDVIAESAMAAILAERGASSDAEERRALGEALYRPSVVPTATLLVPGLDGTIAIRRETIFADSTRWTRFDSAAQFLDEFHLARGDRVLTHEGDRIWFRSTNGDGEEEIVMARIERPSAQ